MFGTDSPSEVGYFKAHSFYEKKLLREAQRTDTHVYRILSTRLTMDITALKTFAEQDSRLVGQEQERFDNYYRQATDCLRDAFYFPEEAVLSSEEMTEVAELLDRQDKCVQW